MLVDKAGGIGCRLPVFTVMVETDSQGHLAPVDPARRKRTE